jgi:hypothetical protein
MASETDHLIKLLIYTDGIVHSWIKLLLTVEAGMVLVLGFVLRPSESGTELDVGLRLAISFGVPLFGMVFAVGICLLIIRERRWVNWYVQKLKNPNLSPTIMPPTGAISEQGLGYSTWVIIGLVSIMVCGWIFIFIVLKPWRFHHG